MLACPGIKYKPALGDSVCNVDKACKKWIHYHSLALRFYKNICSFTDVCSSIRHKQQVSSLALFNSRIYVLFNSRIYIQIEDLYSIRGFLFYLIRGFLFYSIRGFLFYSIQGFLFYSIQGFMFYLIQGFLLYSIQGFLFLD